MKLEKDDMNSHEKLTDGTSEDNYTNIGKTECNRNSTVISESEENHDLSSIVFNSQTDDVTNDSYTSAAEVSVDYSINTSKNDYPMEKISSKDDDISSDISSNSSITTQNKSDLELIKRERDCARDEAAQAQDKLNAIMEAIHILTRQLKKTSTSTSSSSTTETTTTHEILEAPSYASEALSKNTQEQTLDPMVRNRLSSDGSGATTGSIAAYVTKDMLRFSEIVRQCSSSSTIGSSLIALDAACRSLEQNAKWTSEESSMVLQDLQLAQAELNEVDFRCHRAEKCAKQLYKQNLVLKKELEKSKAEKRVLVREIRALMEEKEDREAFQKRLVENMKAHEEIMIEQTGSSSNTRNGGVREMEGIGGDEALKGIENTENEESKNNTPNSVICHHSLPQNNFREKFPVFLSDEDSVARLNDFDTTAMKNSGSDETNESLDSYPVLQLSPSRSKWKSKKSMLNRSDLSPVHSENDEDADILKCSSQLSSDLTVAVSSPCSTEIVLEATLFDLCTDGDDTQCKKQRDRQCLIS